MTTLKLTITYTNGNKVTHAINYLHEENGKLYFTTADQVTYGFNYPVIVPLANIDTFDVEQVAPCFEGDVFEQTILSEVIR